MIILLIVMTGLMAGIYFAFSIFIMKSFSELPVQQAAQVMNKINDVIVNTWFLPLFFGSTLWYAALFVWSFADWQQNQSMLLVAAALIYIIGMFLVTAFGNVPLNNALKASESNNELLERAWDIYLRKWTLLNHFRTISCIASCVVLCIALT